MGWRFGRTRNDHCSLPPPTNPSPPLECRTTGGERASGDVPHRCHVELVAVQSPHCKTRDHECTATGNRDGTPRPSLVTRAVIQQRQQGNMICVSIGCGSHTRMIQEHERLVEQGAELVELRLDYIRKSVNLNRILADRRSPVVITVRREKDGGKWMHSEEQRQMLLRSAIAEQVEYIDLEDDIAENIPRFGDTKRIISIHDFVKTPDDLHAIYDRLRGLDPDIVKIATMANNPKDCSRMIEVMKKADVPTIAICMGDMGTSTRVLCGKYGAPFTYAAFSSERSMAPGQISFRQMVDIYDFAKLNEETSVFGVIADPVGHSMSPVVHNAAFLAKGMNKVYLPFRVPREHLDQFIKDCPLHEIKGLSITIPHKEAIIKHCTKVDGASRGIGAVNTVVFDGDEILGFNTDYKAAMACLDQRLGGGSKTPLDGHSAMVLGAGGAARAIAFGLMRRGADTIITNRTNERAEALAEELGCRSLPWASRHEQELSVLVNATPVGMHPHVDESPYDAKHLRPNAIVFDTVYNPGQTLLYKQAKERKCQVISGIEMFVGQANLQFKLFTGEDAPEGLIEERLKRAIGAARY